MNLYRSLIFILVWWISSCHVSHEPTHDTESIENPAAPEANRPGGSTDVGSGSDPPYPGKTLAWFVGKPTHTYCVRLDPNFAVSLTAFQESVARAYAQWRQYFEEKDVYGSFALRAENVGCDKNPDLVFYVGNSELPAGVLEAAKKRGFADPLGVAVPQTGTPGWWQKGYIALRTPKAADYYSRFPKALDALLQHELGHVLGSPHIPGTIMSVHLHDWIFNTMAWDAKRPPPDDLTRIDWTSELTMGTKEKTFKAEIDCELAKALVNYLKGEKPQSKICEVWLHRRGAPSPSGSEWRSLSIKIGEYSASWDIDSLGKKSNRHIINVPSEDLAPFRFRIPNTLVESRSGHARHVNYLRTEGSQNRAILWTLHYNMMPGYVHEGSLGFLPIQLSVDWFGNFVHVAAFDTAPGTPDVQKPIPVKILPPPLHVGRVWGDWHSED